MNKLLIIILLLTTSVKLFSQQVEPCKHSFLEENKFEKYQKMKTTGTILIATGSVVLIGGAYIYINNYIQLLSAQSQINGNPNQAVDLLGLELKLVGGELLLDVGAVAIAGGAVMCFIAHKKLIRLNNKLSMVAAPNYFRIVYTF